jgi:hypothetical protein
MAKHGRCGKLHFALDDVEVGMTNAARRHPHEHLAGLGCWDWDFLNLQGCLRSRKNRSSHAPGLRSF